MKKFLLLFIFFIFSLSVIPAFAQEKNPVDLYFFYGQGCPHCAKMSTFLEEMEESYSTVTVFEKEIYSNTENRELFQEMSDAFEVEISGVPTVFIGDKVIVGFSNSVGEELEDEIQKCIAERCSSPLEKLKNNDEQKSLKDGELSEKLTMVEKLTVPAVLIAAAVDAINPCAFAVLVILLTTILGTGIKKRALFAGLAFTASIYISYFLMGIGLFSAIQASGLSHGFFIIVSVLAILIGLFNLKDYLWYGKWFVMEVPLSWRPAMKKIIRGVTSVPGSFLTGFVVSLFLLPCTSGPYIVILGMLAQTTTRGYALFLLLLYNFVFVLPMILITMAIYFGFTTTEKTEEWRQNKLRILHLFAGIIILLLGVGMLVSLWLGAL
jgi:cytochrome c biogenesis protein CcdA/glutaredoxin